MADARAWLLADADAESLAEEGTAMTTTTAPVTPAVRGLLDWLDREHVGYELHTHPEAFTARGTARAEGVDPHTFAKVVGVRVDGHRPALLVVDATDQVDLFKAAAALGGQSIELLPEAELAQLAPGCEAGAIPAVGRLFGLEMVVDYAVGEDREISFNAGTHRCSVRVDRAAWEHAAHVRYASLVMGDTGPAWAHS